jgi:hypothetical protein
MVQDIFKKLWSEKPGPTTNSVVISLTKYKDWHLGSQQRLTSTSRFNPHSAYVVAQIVNFLIKEKIPEKDIMVLSFYLDQVRFHTAVLGDAYPQLRICTVDSSQGSQAAVVIVDSVVFGGATGETVGFLGHEYRRVNVAMSRAEVGRILVGHKDFCKNKKFDKGNYWLQFYDQEKNHVVDDTKIRDWKLPEQVMKAFNDAKAGFEKPPLQEHVNMARHRGNTRHAEAMVASMRANPAKLSQDAMALTRTPYKNPSRPKTATAEFVEMTGIDWKLAERYMNSTRGNVEEALRQMRGEQLES